MKSAAGLGGMTPVDIKFNMGARFSFSSVIWTINKIIHIIKLLDSSEQERNLQQKSSISSISSGDSLLRSSSFSRLDNCERLTSILTSSVEDFSVPLTLSAA